jgi:hypothetical protein
MFAFANALQEDGKKKIYVKYAKDNLIGRLGTHDVYSLLYYVT